MLYWTVTKGYCNNVALICQLGYPVYSQILPGIWPAKVYFFPYGKPFTRS